MKQRWKKPLSWLLTLSLVLSLIPAMGVTALADEVEPQENESQNEDYTNGFAEDGSYQPAVLAEDGFYEISNAGQLYWFAQLANGYYNSSSDYNVGQNEVNARLTDDITVNEKISDAARTWMPIGSETLRYMGTFDGNGYSICGLYFPGATSYTDEAAEHYAATVVVYEKNGGVVKNGAVNGDVDAGLFGFIGKNGVVKNVTVKNYDTSDQCQDGYYTISFERYVSQWFDHQVMAENERNQQYVTVK